MIRVLLVVSSNILDSILNGADLGAVIFLIFYGAEIDSGRLVGGGANFPSKKKAIRDSYAKVIGILQNAILHVWEF